MLSQGLAPSSRKILQATTERENKATVVTTTATLTKAVRRAFGDRDARDERWRFLPELRTVETRGLHKATDRCRLELVDVVGKDKLEELPNLLKGRRRSV